MFPAHRTPSIEIEIRRKIALKKKEQANQRENYIFLSALCGTGVSSQFNEALHRLEEHNDLGKIIIDPPFEKDSEKALEAKANIFERCVSCAKPACCPDVEE